MGPSNDRSNLLYQLSGLEQVDLLCDQFEAAYQRGEQPRIEDFLARAGDGDAERLLSELVQLEMALLQRDGRSSNSEEYRRRFPNLRLSSDRSLDRSGVYAGAFIDETSGGEQEFSAGQDRDEAVELPSRIGRYRIQRVLGKGGFGMVYQARDEQLNRLVAIKVPHAKLISRPEDAATYVNEARMVANLDHAGIVPVYDVGSADQFPCYIVSKFIEGSDLATRSQQHRMKFSQSADLVATVAEALHYAHKQGLVHRDVKPGNILISKDGQPYVVDFGLALREESVGQGPRYAGTPAYMSPEQARGEGHRVDGRSDIFSLGTVFYELLVGRRAFKGDTVPEVFEQITSYEPRPPRQYDDRIPKELERICHKSMAKRASERYSTALDMASDLRLFLREQSLLQPSTTPGTPYPSPATPQHAPTTPNLALSTPQVTSPQLFADSQPIKIVPKGLRSFDAHDADFFLELLPGARDREGLPDSLRFWKTRIEQTDAEQTFTVGLIYGPSGCGKSSMVKAGLLPRLSEEVIAVYIEATPTETEARLLANLHKRCPTLEEKLSLKETLAALRRGAGIPVGKKVLIVIDQFEQWLHAKRNEEHTELVAAIRQCDGGRVQCIVMVRDDFWMAATRFMRELEVWLVEGENSAAVDLFPIRHAEKVLTAFGRAYSALPADFAQLTADQKGFIAESIDGLSEDGKVICVRLALFAEMMKGKSWTPATLKEVGGAKGVGVTFLEETFSASTAPPEHRYHQKAARAVLAALLPDSGTDIKGAMRSRAELMAASGYTDRLKDFADLLRMLDIQIRLITPTDPEGIENTLTGIEVKLAAGASTADTPISRTALAAVSPEQPEVATANSEIKSASAKTGANAARLIAVGAETGANAQRLMGNEPEQLGQLLYYQLTHDYLVPSLRDWLTRKQRETKKGRAELKLAERAATWAAKPEAKQLPSLWEWISIRRLTEKAKWKPGELQLMARANRYHLTRTGLVSAMWVMLLLGVGALKRWNDARQLERDATNLVAALQTTDFSKIPEMIERLDSMRAVADPKLKAALEEFEPQSDERLKLSLGLLASTQQSSGSGQVDYLVQRLLTAQASQVTLLISQLQPYSQTILPQLWEAAQQHDPKTLLQSASALAKYDPDSQKWQTIARQVAGHVVQENPLRVTVWIDALRPAAKALNPELQSIYASAPESRSQTEIDLATEMLDSYAAEDFQLLHELILVGQPKQFSKLFDKYARFRQQAIDALRGELARPLNSGEPSAGENAPGDDAEAQRLAYIQRQANAAVALFRLEDPEPVYQFLTVDRDPEALSQFIYRIRGREVSPSLLIKSVQELQAKAVPTEPQERQQHYYRLYGFVLGLGENSFDQLPAQQREAFAVELAELYGTHPSRAVHSALGWLLRRWGQDEAVKRVDETPLDYDESGVREWYVIQIKPPVKNRVRNRAAANPAGNSPIDLKAPIYFKMIVFPGGEFDMGDPGATKRVKVAGPIAVSDREVTWRQFGPIDGDTRRQSWERQLKKTVGANVPTFGVNWFEAVNYCRWLTSAMGLDEQSQSYEKIEIPAGTESVPGWIELPNDSEWPMRIDRPGIRLPTEAEWEYVARAGSETQYSFGTSDSLLAEYCWYVSSSNQWSHPTGQLRPSVGGLFDIHGNLWEWTDDWFTKGSGRVARGGGWGFGASNCRAALRNFDAPTLRSASYGFRLAQSPSSQAQVTAESKLGGGQASVSEVDR